MSISIVIPCYNAEKYLETTIKSILNQTMAPDEIILIDDCSKDNSVKIAEKYDKVAIYHNERNMGIGYTRQAGLDKSDTDFVGFLSADDVYHKKFIEKTLPRCRNDRGIYTDFYRCDSQLRPFEIFRSIDFSFESIIDWAARKNVYINFSTIVVPKAIDVKFVKELRRGEDVIFLLDTLIYSLNKSHFEWERIREPLLYYRIHSLQGTFFYSDEETILIWRYIKDRLIKLGIDGHLIDMIYNNSKNRGSKNRYNIFSVFRKLLNKIL